MNKNNSLVPKTDIQVILRQTSNLIRITDKILQRPYLTIIDDDSWINRLIEWADQKAISEDKFPRDANKIKNLTEINLGRPKNFSVPFMESTLTELPPEIGKLQKLEKLILDDHDLTELPPEIGQLQNLQYLSIEKCNKLVQCPPVIFELQNLKGISISDKVLSGFLSEAWKLIELQELRISCDGSIKLPPQIGELKNLRKLDIWGEGLAEFPLGIFKLQNLKSLDLGSFSLKEIPPEIGKLQSLQCLFLSCFGQMTKLPSQIGELKNLKRISIIACDKLTQLPSEIGELKNLESLSVVLTPLIELPAEIGKLRKLKELDLDMEYITENCKSFKICPEIGNLPALETLSSIAGDYIELPSEISNISTLKNVNENIKKTYESTKRFLERCGCKLI